MHFAPAALVLALVSTPPSSSVTSRPDAGRLDGSTSVAKKKATKESVTALKDKMAHARDQLQALIDQPAPTKMTRVESEAYTKFVNATKVVIEDLGKASKKLDDGLKDSKSDVDSLSEMGERESLRLQEQMQHENALMSTVSNMLKKIADSAQTITQNMK